jgi:hypothetical protein
MDFGLSKLNTMADLVRYGFDLNILDLENEISDCLWCDMDLIWTV